MNAGLTVLAVSPSSQRQGVGRGLVDWGVQVAHRQGWEVYLRSSPGKLAQPALCDESRRPPLLLQVYSSPSRHSADGLGLYESLGFVPSHTSSGCPDPLALLPLYLPFPPLLSCGHTHNIGHKHNSRINRNILLSSATPSDLPSLAPLHRLAFAANPNDRLIFGRVTPAARDAHNAASLARELASPSSRVVKATRAGRIVGFAVWHWPKEGEGQEAGRGGMFDAPSFPEGTEVELVREWVGGWDVGAPEGAKFVELELVVVSPEVQGQGVGRALLKQGLEEAEQAGLDVYLLSTAAGVPAYLAAGFEKHAPLITGGRPDAVLTIQPMRRRLATKAAEPIQVVPATASDLAAIARIFRTSFGPSTLFRTIWGAVDPAAFERHWEASMGHYLTEPKRAEGYELVVVRRGAGVLGFSLMQRHSGIRPTEPEEKQVDPEGTDVATKEAFFTRLHALEDRIEGPYFFFHIIATDPAFFRTGAARAVLRHGIAQADAAGVDAYLDASPDGLPVYVKHGFERDGRDLVVAGPLGDFGATPMCRRRRLAPNLPGQVGETVLVPATAADLPAIGGIFRRAFEPSVLYRRIWPDADPDEVGASWARGTAALVTAEKMRKDPHELYMVRRGGQVVGYGLWQVHSGVWPSPDEPQEEEEEEEPNPPGTDEAVHKHFFTSMHAMQHRIKEPHLFFHLIATDPAFFKTGGARAILEAGIARADALSVDCYLDATAAGLPVYPRFGFVRDGEEMKGLTGDFGVVPMVRRRVAEL